MKTRLIIPLLFAVLFLVNGCEKQQEKKNGKESNPGPAEYIFGYWQPDGYYYGARVLGRNAAGVHVLYGDGTRRTLSSGTRPPRIPAAGRVQALWKNKKYYALKSWKQEGMVVHVIYEDETRETVSLEQIRFTLHEEAD